MNLASDNAYGAMPEIVAALAQSNNGPARSYGDDDITARVRTRLRSIFEHEVFVYPVVTGTAANALSLATLVPPHGAIICHADSHIAVDECGAPEFFSHGAKLVPLEGAHAKIAPPAIEHALAHFQKGFVHHAQPTAISLTQATERGTVYSLAELHAISGVARKHDLKLHMDGARFANALVHLGCSPADATWRAGVDALSFGATKNGALGAEAVIFFHEKDVADFEYRRKKSGHLLSKMRFLSAQLDAYLENDRWLKSAARANALARKLGEALSKISGAELADPVEANAVFVRLPDETVARLRKEGAVFYNWTPPNNGKTLVRLVVSFATPDEAVERFIATAGG
ncbi:MAG TPA: low specificity L-threonine aldolase [Rhizomicrobium sp.]|nr:low specificity L-threonine aldolase [Rhizomicrobium sp.]